MKNNVDRWIKTRAQTYGGIDSEWRRTRLIYRRSLDQNETKIRRLKSFFVSLRCTPKKWPSIIFYRLDSNKESLKKFLSMEVTKVGRAF
jgi:hypothetical protein